MDEYTEHLGGVLKFRARVVAHLVVAELSCLPCRDKMKSFCHAYLWEPTLDKWFGGHAHINGQEVYVVQRGTMEVKLFDGVNWETFELERGDCLFIPTMIWHEVRGGAMMVLKDVGYDREKNYIEDLDIFCEAKNK